MQSNPPSGLTKVLAPSRLTAVVDIGSNPIDGAPPYAEMLVAGLCSVVGFEPQKKALDVLNTRKGPHERYYPYAIGDGSLRTLKLCAAEGMSSLLSPDPDKLALFSDFPKFGAVIGEASVQTKRLDDVEEIEAIDLLKIDIQGGELDAISSGRTKLASAVAIQTEVSFVPLYRDQPCLGAIDALLRGMGFIPHCFAELKTWPVAPFKGFNSRQLLEADLVYVRDFTRPQNMSGEQWKHLALIAHHCYKSADLAMYAIQSAVKLGAVEADAPVQYIEMLRPPGMARR